MNVFTFCGNLGNDCRIGSAGGTNVVNFSVAVKSGYGDKEQTLWIDCALWGKRGESLAQYLLKGQKVVVSGELGSREHEGKTYLTCRVNEITLAGGGSQTNEQPRQSAQQQSQSGNQSTAAPFIPDQDFDDDIPF